MKKAASVLMATAASALCALGLAGGQPGLQQDSDLTQAQNNVKALGVSIMMYATDYDDRLPYAASTEAIKRQVYPYCKKMSLWKHPVRGEVLYNTSLSGVNFFRYENPGQTMMLWEKNATSGLRVTCSVNAFVKTLTDAGWKNAWEAELKRRKSKK